MEELEIDGRLVKQNEELREGVKDFFSMLYSKDFNWRFKLDDLGFYVSG